LELISSEYLFTGVYGDVATSDERIKKQLEKLSNNEYPDYLPEVQVNADKAIVAGFFKKEDSFSVLVVNSHNPFSTTCNAKISMDLGEYKAINTIGGVKTSGTSVSGTSKIELELESGQGALVTFHCR
jgi:hypothetical protein